MDVNEKLYGQQAGPMRSIFDYLEYRDYLREHFNYEKSEKSFYSYRYIATKTGIDAGYYVKILQKQKHVGNAKVEILADFLKLTGRKREYFITLIAYNRTRKAETAKELFNKLITIKNAVGSKISHYNYFAQWYTIPVRELLYTYDFDGDCKKMGRCFSPPLKESEVKKAIKTLTDLEMIVEDKDGFLRPKDNLLTSNSQWDTAAVRDFQRKMIDLAGEALERFPKEERNISSVTVSTTSKNMELISDILTQSRRQIMELISSDDDADGVYQINLQVFPLTKREEL